MIKKGSEGKQGGPFFVCPLYETQFIKYEGLAIRGQEHHIEDGAGGEEQIY